MTLVSVRPNNTTGTPSGVTLTGTTIHEALSDTSNDSYIQLNNDARVRVVFPDPAPPGESGADGELPGFVRLRVRAKKIDIADTDRHGQNPEVQFTLNGYCGRPIPDRPWHGIGMEATNRIWWEEITTVRARGDFPHKGIAIAHSPEDMALVIERDEDDNYWEPRIYEIWADTWFVPRPRVRIVKPKGTIPGVTHPDVRWRTNPGNLGGPQTHYQVKFFDDATYSGGGFNVNSTTPEEGSSDGSQPGNVRTWRPDEPLIDDDYRVYVRAAQTVHGVRWWSTWAFAEFTLGTPRPAVPDLILADEDTNARIRIDLDENAGAETTEWFQVLRSEVSDEGPWEGVRTSLGRGLVRNTGDGPFDAFVYDYEAGNGQEVWYKARAASVDGPRPQPDEFLEAPLGDWLIFSRWTAVQSDTWQDDRWWFKHPYNSALNVKRYIVSQPGRSRSARAEVFQPLGRADAIAVTDRPTPYAGDLIVRNDSDAERAEWDALLAGGYPILIHAPNTLVPDWATGWYHISENSRERAFDKQWIQESYDKISWQKIARPTSAQTDNPTIPPSPSDDDPSTPPNATPDP